MVTEDSDSWKELVSQKLKKGSLKRRFRRIESSSLKHAHTFIIGRWSNVLEVRRHAIAWLVLVAVLIVAVSLQSTSFALFYTTRVTQNNTAYSEGVVGKLDTLNPIFATSAAERSAASLLFAGLLRYDTHNTITPDLAESWHYGDQGKTVIVTLRPNLRWQDGHPLTSRDVIYTVNMIKNTDIHSPLSGNWQNIAVKADDARTIEFMLPFVYAPFVDALTVGILPEHILGPTTPLELRNSAFNRAPVGSGPFIFNDLKVLSASNEHSILSLTVNPTYHLGAPKLAKFYLHAFGTQEQLEHSYISDEINAAVNFDIETAATLPPTKRATVTDSPLHDGMYAFLRMDGAILKDPLVRRALELGTDQRGLIKRLGSHVMPLGGPLIASQLADGKPLSPQADYDLAKARSLLDQAGWIVGKNGFRSKAGQKLSLMVATSQSGDFPLIASVISEQWAKLGITVQTQLASPDTIQQSVIAPRAYDVLIYEIVLGRDADVYAYWHSSQIAVSGLNLSNYKSGIVDDALESARVRLEQNLRDAKYRAFYQQWQADVPAIALFQPALHYAENPGVVAFTPGRVLIDTTSRYSDVQYWAGSKIINYATP